MNNNLTIVRGDTFSFVAVFNDLGVDLDAAHFTIRTAPDAPDPPVLQKTLLDGITKVGTGKYKVTLSHSDTAALNSAHYVYDFQITIGTDVATILLGLMSVVPDVTR